MKNRFKIFSLLLFVVFCSDLFSVKKVEFKPPVKRPPIKRPPKHLPPDKPLPPIPKKPVEEKEIKPEKAPEKMPPVKEPVKFEWVRAEVPSYEKRFDELNKRLMGSFETKEELDNVMRELKETQDKLRESRDLKTLEAIAKKTYGIYLGKTVDILKRGYDESKSDLKDIEKTLSEVVTNMKNVQNRLQAALKAKNLQMSKVFQNSIKAFRNDQIGFERDRAEKIKEMDGQLRRIFAQAEYNKGVKRRLLSEKEKLELGQFFKDPPESIYLEREELVRLAVQSRKDISSLIRELRKEVSYHKRSIKQFEQQIEKADLRLKKLEGKKQKTEEDKKEITIVINKLNELNELKGDLGKTKAEFSLKMSDITDLNTEQKDLLPIITYWEKKIKE